MIEYSLYGEMRVSNVDASTVVTLWKMAMGDDSVEIGDRRLFEDLLSSYQKADPCGTGEDSPGFTYFDFVVHAAARADGEPYLKIVPANPFGVTSDEPFPQLNWLLGFIKSKWPGCVVVGGFTLEAAEWPECRILKWFEGKLEMFDTRMIPNRDSSGNRLWTVVSPSCLFPVKAESAEEAIRIFSEASGAPSPNYLLALQAIRGWVEPADKDLHAGDEHWLMRVMERTR